MRRFKKSNNKKVFAKSAICLVMAISLMVNSLVFSDSVYAEDEQIIQDNTEDTSEETTSEENTEATTEATTEAKVKETRGWHRDTNGKYYYVNKKGKRIKQCWIIVKKKKYYLDEEGYRVCGFAKIDDKYYYMHKTKGYCLTGWRTVNGYKYFFNAAGFAITSTWYNSGEDTYYLMKNGRAATGWKKIKKRRYYFDSDGVLLKDTFTPDGNYVDAQGKKLRKSTIKKFLKTALKPVGSTMYVWGGGWGAKEGVTIGTRPRWKKFYKRQSSSYDYTQTRFQVHDGLDCSGFVGWTVYNTFNTTNNNASYVMLAHLQAPTFANKGWGKYKAPGTFYSYKAGDVMSSSGHVYIVIGQCPDSSVVLVHSSPKGVQINGTPTRSGYPYSQAYYLAKKYMKKYYPEWTRKYPVPVKSPSYLTSYGRMRWKVKGKNCIMRDPDKYRSKTAEQILKDLFK